LRLVAAQVFDRYQDLTGLKISQSTPREPNAIIPSMQSLRRAHTLARLVLVWFALSIGVAIASPLVKPQAMELICSGAGAIKLMVSSNDGAKELSGHTLDCPLCASLSAPPAVARQTAEPAQALAHVLHSIPATRIAARVAAPLPARGPPASS
jgi:hypothetical protein